MTCCNTVDVAPPLNVRVFVYFNLHKHLFSVKALSGFEKGRVIYHASNVYLNEVEFKVNEAGRQRVLKEKRKNVHAGVIGWLGNPRDVYSTTITYNPYKYNSFVKMESAIRVTNADNVHMTLINGTVGRIYAHDAW
jgi:hypothetical protein